MDLKRVTHTHKQVGLITDQLNILHQFMCAYLLSFSVRYRCMIIINIYEQ